MSDLFSKEKVNTGRQVELDIAKALAIIFMIFLHTVMVVKGFNYSLTPAYDFIVSNVLGRPRAAPVFMFCMGVGYWEFWLMSLNFSCQDSFVEPFSADGMFFQWQEGFCSFVLTSWHLLVWHLF